MCRVLSADVCCLNGLWASAFARAREKHGLAGRSYDLSRETRLLCRQEYSRRSARCSLLRQAGCGRLRRGGPGRAAYAQRKTGRPVGLIVWRGAHASVMSGFTATADPLTDPDYRVTGVYAQDSWFPRVSSIWGPGQKPNSWISIDALKSDFLRRRGGQWQAELAGNVRACTARGSAEAGVRDKRMI